MSENMELYIQLQKTPPEAQKRIAAGRLKGMTDINPMWRIKRLTEVFGPCGIGWWYEITDKRIEEGANGEKKAFVDINLFYKWNGEISRPIQGTGGSSFVSAETKGLYTSDECFKMALTDAIGISCKAIGMSADIYFQKDQSKYDLEPEPQPQPQLITANDAAALTNLAKRKGVVIDDVLKKYKLKELKDMPFALYQKVVSKMKGAPDAEVQSTF